MSASRLMILALLLVAAVRPEAFDVGPDQLAENRALWEALGAEQKDGLRRTWEAFQALPEAEQRTLRQRMTTLTRLQAQHARRLGTPAGEAELRELLEGLPDRFRSRLGGAAPQPATSLAAGVRVRTRVRIEAFLDNLVALGRLDIRQRPDPDLLPWSDYVQRCLELRTQEELALAERGGAATGALAAASQSPLDVADHMRERRRVVGYLGRAAKYLEITAEERRELAALPDEELFHVIKDRMESRIRALLEERDTPPELVEAILQAPFRVQERRLDALLARP